MTVKNIIHRYIVAAALVFTVVAAASCSRRDDKAGYPVNAPSPAPQTEASPRPSKAVKSQAFKPAIKAPPGPAGDLAARFCSFSVAADFKGLSKLFSAEFMLRSSFPDDAERQLGDAEIAKLAGETYDVIASDIKSSRIKPTRECEVVEASATPCDTAIAQALQRSPEKVSSYAIKSAMKSTGATNCGFITVREISASGIQESSFFAGDPGGEWKLLINVMGN